jgi:hypothetical protein
MDKTDYLDAQLDALLAVEAFEKGDRDALNAVIAANEQHLGRLVAGMAHLVAYIARLCGDALDDDDMKASALPLIHRLRREVLDMLGGREEEP